MSSYHRLMAEAGSSGIPLFPAHGTKLIRSPEKAMHAKVIRATSAGKPPSNALTLTGWPGSTPKTEKLFAWKTANGIVFATPHNGKAGLVTRDGFAFIPADKRRALGIEAPKAPKAKGKKAKAGAKAKAKAKAERKLKVKAKVKARKASK